MSTTASCSTKAVNDPPQAADPIRSEGEHIRDDDDCQSYEYHMIILMIIFVVIIISMIINIVVAIIILTLVCVSVFIHLSNRPC